MMGQRPGPRTQGEHLSELVFDRLLAAEREGLAAANQHLEGCTACQRKLERLRAEQQASMGQLTARVERLMAAAESTNIAGVERDGRGWIQNSFALFGRNLVFRGLGAAAAAAIIVTLAWVTLSEDFAEEPIARDVVRLKGPSSKIEVLRIQGNRAIRLEPRQVASAGDRLGFQAQCRQPCWVLLLVLDATAQQGATLLEHDKPSPWRLEPSAEPTVLPVQVVLDQQSQDERFVALFCRGKPDRRGIVNAIAGVLSDNSPAEAAAQQPTLRAHDCVMRLRTIRRRGSAREK